jgi:hypothetical protein
MASPWKKVADVAIGGLTDVGFVPRSSLLMVASHQGRGLLDLITGDRVARDRQETGTWFDASRPAVLGIGPLDGQWINVAGLAGGHLPVTDDGRWLAGVAGRPGRDAFGPRRELVEVNEPEEIRAFGFSPDGATFVVASSPSIMIFRRNTPEHRLRPCHSRPICGMSGYVLADTRLTDRDLKFHSPLVLQRCLEK